MMMRVEGPAVTTAPVWREARTEINKDLAQALLALDRAVKAAERLANLASTEGDSDTSRLWLGHAGRLRVASETAADLIR